MSNLPVLAIDNSPQLSATKRQKVWQLFGHAATFPRNGIFTWKNGYHSI